MPESKVRVEFFRDAQDTRPTASVWCVLAAGESGPTLRLLHPSPDLQPGPGWRVRSRAGAFEVVRVQDGLIHCVPAGGARRVSGGSLIHCDPDAVEG